MRIWKSLGHKRRDVLASKAEFDEELPVGEAVRQLSRRDFFRWSGVGFAVGLASGCDSKKAHKALALVQGRDGFTPGTDLWFATTCAGCAAGCGALAKSRDGRVIKLEGNPEHPVGRGALCAVGQAQLRDLYDGERLKAPRLGGKDTDWSALDADLSARLKAAQSVRVLSGTITSPTLRKAVDGFLKTLPGAALVQYDALSASALAEAYARTHGVRLVPDYRFEKADFVLGVEADFLGTWINPAGFGRAYASRRTPDKPSMSRHVQVESGLSLTGSNADTRIRVAPSEAAAFLEHLAAAVEHGAPLRPLEPKLAAKAAGLAAELRAHAGRSLVVCGLNDLHAQIFAARINHALGNEGATVELARPSLQRQGDDAALHALLQDLAAGRVDALVVLDANPAFEVPGFAAAAAKVPLKVGLLRHDDETAALCTHVAPDHHPLETWRDSEAVAGVWSLHQPLLEPLFGTRDAAESFAAWSGSPTSAQDQVKALWRTEVFPTVGGLDFDAFWHDAVQRGFADLGSKAAAPAYQEDRAKTQAEGSARPAPKAAAHELLLYAKAGNLDGRHAHNPWLQELPDPITKITWDNYAQLSPGTAEALKLKQGDVVRLRAAGLPDLVLPVAIQPGLHGRTVAVALGYGRTRAGKHGTHVGQDAFPWVGGGELRSYQGLALEVSPTPQHLELACTQDHHLMEGREPVREMAYAAYAKDPASARPHAPHGGMGSLYREHPKGKHQWAMVIDLSKCSGCSACVISCQAENNLPVVGKDEVRRKREMHWMRLDRYYTGSEEEPGVVHQPMFCQQCGNAPCENVCPVIATVHSEEGLNQQVYNRCVGTRYCANNCPYKVRRFNWFEYDRSDPVENLALNPDVTVRSRGVMEKCSFCIQRIQRAKADAKNEGREVKDGEFQTACQQSCPGMAILFGDLQDPASEISQALKDPKRYLVLGELGVLPAVSYLTKIRNSEMPNEGAAPGGHHA
jgi:molybdopterin-containing oxidoreductase family iron-sulfur binding subunit